MYVHVRERERKREMKDYVAPISIPHFFNDYGLLTIKTACLHVSMQPVVTYMYSTCTHTSSWHQEKLSLYYLKWNYSVHIIYINQRKREREREGMLCSLPQTYFYTYIYMYKCMYKYMYSTPSLHFTWTVQCICCLNRSTLAIVVLEFVFLYSWMCFVVRNWIM